MPTLSAPPEQVLPVEELATLISGLLPDELT